MMMLFSFPWKTIVENQADYALLESDTYVLTAIFCVLSLALAYIMAVSIAYQPNKSDYRKRRTYFWLIGVVFTVTFFVYNYFLVGGYIEKTMLQLKFLGLKNFGLTISMTLAVFLVYLGVSFVLAKTVFKHKKFGTIFS